jgi:uncharacterized membrane protein
MKRAIIHHMALAHHRLEDLHRCVLIPWIPWGQARVAVCARCLVLYPSLLVVLGGQIAFRAGSLGGWDRWLVLAGVVPMLVDWGVGRLGWARGSNVARGTTGMLGGAALGRGLYLYFRDTSSEAFWLAVVVVALVVIAVEIVRALGLKDMPG